MTDWFYIIDMLLHVVAAVEHFFNSRLFANLHVINLLRLKQRSKCRQDFVYPSITNFRS